MRNHEYRDVTHSLVEEFDSASSEDSRDVIGKPNKLWMCGNSCRSIEIGPQESADAKKIREKPYAPLALLEAGGY